MATAKTIQPEPAEPPEETRGRGRPPGSKHDPEIVRDIAVQVLIAFYNTPAGQVRLAKRIEDDANFVEKLRMKAQFMDVIVRAWLDVLTYVPRAHPQFKVEAAFRFWCLRLEPPQPPTVLDAKAAREVELRGVYLKHCTPEHWERNCKPWIEAIDRVQHDRQIKLIVPTVEEDDEW